MRLLASKLPLRLSRLSVIAILAISPVTSTINHAPAEARSSRGPARLQTFDYSQQIDANHIAMYVSNSGSFAWNREAVGQPAGFEYPKGSGNHALFAAGLWLAAQVNGQIRVAVSEYSDEYGPGPIVGSGLGAIPANPNDPVHRVYKLKKDYSQGGDPNADVAAWNTGAVPYGAPPVLLDTNGVPDFVGDQMLWSVFNDLDPALHTGHPGQTAALGVEVQQTTWAFTSNSALGDVVFIRYRVINKGANVLDSMYVGAWSDPDVGDAIDDLVGCDVPRGLGYAYNATNSDGVYGSNPPSAGFDILQGPLVGGGRLPATSFTRYINGTDPSAASHVYGYFRGFDPNGAAIIDPTTSQPTTFMVSGNPIAGTGWIDVNPADRRMLLGSGPFTMAPGDSQEIVVAVMAGQGNDRFDSILRMKAADDAAQALFDRPTPVTVAWLEAWPAYPGIKLRWRLEDQRRFPDAVLERAIRADGPWTIVSATWHREAGVIVALDRDVEPGRTYHYRFVTQGPDGPRVLAQVDATAGASAATLDLAPVRPNPTAGPFRVAYMLPVDARVRLSVLDLSGRVVTVLDQGDRPAGPHEIEWDARNGRNVAVPGVYFVRLEALGSSASRRVAIAP
jgi:hypothetical protein